MRPRITITSQHGTSLHSTARHGTAQHSTTRHITPRHATSQHGTAQHATSQHNTSLQEERMISTIVARCTIKGISPYCQSRPHDTPHNEGEPDDVYDLRTWRQRLHVTNGTVRIPAWAIHDGLTEAAKRSMRKIPGKGQFTWTQKFAAGIALLEDPDLGINPETVDYVAVYCHVTGIRGSGKRVIRRFPIMPQWQSTFDVQILDPIITEDVFGEMLEDAGMYVGIGQNRPQNRGTHGRFRPSLVEWIGQAEPDLRRVRAA